jgi:hypothetical protein
LEEVYFYLVEEVGSIRARVWFWLQVSGVVIVWIGNIICCMYKNYLKIPMGSFCDEVCLNGKLSLSQSRDRISNSRTGITI